MWVQRYIKYLTYANFGGIFCRNHRITSDTMNDEKSPIQSGTKEERHYCRYKANCADCYGSLKLTGKAYLTSK